MDLDTGTAEHDNRHWCTVSAMLADQENLRALVSFCKGVLQKEAAMRDREKADPP